MAIIMAITLVLTPYIFVFPLEGGNTASNMKDQKAFAATIGILQTQNLDATFNNNTGELVLDISGTKLLGLELISTQQFVYQMPAELGFILNHSSFKDAARIELREPLIVNKTIYGSDLIVNSADRTVKGYETQVNLTLVTSISAKLIINLYQLGLTVLPPSPDGKLEFYGIAANDSLITVNILVSQGATDEIDTGVLDVIAPNAPVINTVTDVDTVVTGTGEKGAVVQIITPTGSYEGPVDDAGNYSINIPVQEAGTTITASQTDAAGNKSVSASTVVVGTILELTVPSEIRFKQTVIGFDEVTIPREITGWSISVRDTRGQGSKWRIKAKAPEPLTSKDGYTLDPSALVFTKNNQIHFLLDETLIYEGMTGPERETEITWNENEGILIKVVPSNAQPGVEYTTTIHWTLENAP